MLRDKEDATPLPEGGHIEGAGAPVPVPAAHPDGIGSRMEPTAYSARELRNLAWNCRSLARQTEAEQVEIFLIQMADDFERKAGGLERRRAPIGSGRY